MSNPPNKKKASRAQTEGLGSYCNLITEQLKRGRVIPFLGAGINRYERPKRAHWKNGYLPDGGELAEELASKFGFPWKDDKKNLQLVSQAAQVMDGELLYDELYDLFCKNYPAASIHNLLARLPKALRERNYKEGLPLIVTTNYDDVLEKAFRKEKAPFDIVTYIAKRKKDGVWVHNKFWHLANAERYESGDDHRIDEEWKVIALENVYYPPSSGDDRTIILKIHGSIARSASNNCSFVITEDDYIEYLAQMNFQNPLPTFLGEIIKKSRFLYLGYGLRDWNLRVMMKRVVQGDDSEDDSEKEKKPSWAVQRQPTVVDNKFWTKRDVDLVEADLGEFVQEMEKRIEALPPNPKPMKI